MFMKKAALVALLALLALFLLWQMPLLLQEGDPVPLIYGITRLEFNGNDIVIISERKLIQLKGPEAPLSRILSEKGWQFEERLGSGIFYARGDEKLFVQCRMFTRRYMVYELDRSLF